MNSKYLLETIYDILAGNPVSEHHLREVMNRLDYIDYDREVIVFDSGELELSFNNGGDN